MLFKYVGVSLSIVKYPQLEPAKAITKAQTGSDVRILPYGAWGKFFLDISLP